jgi:hypothetical protein
MTRFMPSTVFRLVTVAFALAVLATSGMGDEPSSTWTVEPDVRLRGTGGSFGASCPNTVELADGTYRMYYTDRCFSGPYPTCILSATSSDGLAWSQESGVRIGGGIGGEDGWAGESETVVLPDGTYRMYYNHEWETGGVWFGHIVSATSSDGTDWTKEEGVRVDSGGTYDTVRAIMPSVLRLSDGSYRMYYVGHNGTACCAILSAVSDDGIVWTKEAGIRVAPGSPHDGFHVYQPEVVEVQGGYVMFYAEADSIGFISDVVSAVSPDGLTWTKETGVRLEREYICTGFRAPDIVEIASDQYRMYFTVERYLCSDEPRLEIRSAIGTIGPLTIPATIDMDPDVLNPRSGGRWVTCYIELPSGYDPHDIDQSTVILNETVQAETSPTAVADYDQDGIADRMVKFSRSAVIEILPPGEQVEVRICGQVANGTFAGTDTIRVLMPEVTYPNGGEILEAGEACSITWTSPEGYVPEWYALYYTLDDSQSWNPIAGSVEGTDYPWTIPDAATNLCRILVEAYDAEGIMGYDVSDRTFNICLGAGVSTEEEAPSRLVVYSPKPNPSSQSTSIRFELPTRSHVRLTVHDVQGNKVADLIDRTIPSGPHVAEWNLEDSSGDNVPPGLYFVRLRTEGRAVIRKSVLIR